MQVDEAIEVLSGLEGNEHKWVDFKQDYYIGGIEQKTAEFVRDIASLANSIAFDSESFIFIGVNDDGGIVGVEEDCREQFEERPRHIFSYDESDIQEIVDSNLEPAPSFSFHMYTLKTILNLEFL